MLLVENNIKVNSYLGYKAEGFKFQLSIAIDNFNDAFLLNILDNLMLVNDIYKIEISKDI